MFYLRVISCVEDLRKDYTRPTNGVSKQAKQALFEPVCVPAAVQYTDMSFKCYRPMVDELC